MSFIAIHLTTLQRTCCLSLGRAEESHRMPRPVDMLPAAVACEQYWGRGGPDGTPLWSSNRWKPRLAGLALRTAGECSRPSLANNGTLCLMPGRTRGRGTQRSRHHPARLRTKQTLLQSDISCPAVALNLEGMVGSPREPRTLLWPSLQFRLIKISVSRSGGPHTGVDENSPDGSKVQPGEKHHCRIF